MIGYPFTQIMVYGNPKSGVWGTLKEDIYGNLPTENEQTNGFAIVDDCLGTLLSNTLHLRGQKEYGGALERLRERGYSINLVPHGKTILRELR